MGPDSVLQEPTAIDGWISVPWQSTQEFKTVERLMFSSKQHFSAGVLHLRMWNLRSEKPLVPLECSEILAISIQKYDEYRRDRFAIDPTIVSMLLSNALARSVTLMLCESESQVEGTSSLSRLARQVGLDSDIVDVRHAVVHRSMPSIEVLYDACNRVLSWIQDVFWLPMLTMLNNNQPNHKNITKPDEEQEEEEEQCLYVKKPKLEIDIGVVLMNDMRQLLSNARKGKDPSKQQSAITNHFDLIKDHVEQHSIVLKQLLALHDSLKSIKRSEYEKFLDGVKPMLQYVASKDENSFFQFVVQLISLRSQGTNTSHAKRVCVLLKCSGVPALFLHKVILHLLSHPSELSCTFFNELTASFDPKQLLLTRKQVTRLGSALSFVTVPD